MQLWCFWMLNIMYFYTMNGYSYIIIYLAFTVLLHLHEKQPSHRQQQHTTHAHTVKIKYHTLKCEHPQT